MNNMQKAFKAKATRGLADGGRPDPDALGTGLAQRAGVALAGRRQQIDDAVSAATGVAAPAPVVAPTGYGGMSNIHDGAMPPAGMFTAQRRGLADGGRPDPNLLGSGLAERAGAALAGRQRQIDDAVAAATGGTAPAVAPVGYGGMSNIRDGATPPAAMFVAQRRGLADGGAAKLKPHGGPVRGPGGPTDDKAGKFDLSHGEYVLPSDTVDAVGEHNLDALRDATHTFVNPANRPRGLADGGLGGAYDWMKNKAGSAWQAGKDAVSGFGSGAPGATPGAPPQPKIDPKLSADGFTNAERVAATPPGYATGGLAEAPSTLVSRATGLAKTGGVLAGADQLAKGISGIMQPGDSSVGDKIRAGVGAASFTPGLAPGARAVAGGMTLADMVPDSVYEWGLNKLGLMPEPAANSVLTPAAEAYKAAHPELFAKPGGAAPAAAPAAAPVAALTPEQGAAQAEDTRVGQALTAAGVSAADQSDSPMSFKAAQKSSMNHDAGLGAAKQYKLKGPGYDDGNADIFATSTNPSGKLNSFTGVGNNNRPNWEQRNPADYQAAVARADADKAKLAEIEGSHSADPLREAALAGNSTAGGILRQQMADQSAKDVANIQTTSAQKVGLQRLLYERAMADRLQHNTDRQFEYNKNKDDTARTADYLKTQVGDPLNKDGTVNPASAQANKDIQTLLKGTGANMGNLGPVGAEDALKIQKIATDSQPGAFRTALSRIGIGNVIPDEGDITRKMPARGSQIKRGLWGSYFTDADGVDRYVPGGGMFEAPQADTNRLLQEFSGTKRGN